MKIVTRYPVIYRDANWGFSNLDGKSTSGQIKHFQNWSNKIKGTNLKVDGKWGSKTASAWKSNGASYEAAFQAAGSTLASVFGPSSYGSSSSDPAASTPKEKGQFFGKAKGWFGKVKDSGLFEKGKEAFGQTKFGQKAGGYKDQYSGGGAGPAQSGGATGLTQFPEEKKGMNKTLKYVLIGGAVLVALWGASKFMKANAAKPPAKA